MSITRVLPEVQHYPSCDAMAIGRHVQWLAQHNVARFALDVVITGLDGFRAPCECFRIQLAAAETELRLTRKHDPHDEQIPQLTAVRDALRAAVK